MDSSPEKLHSLDALMPMIRQRLAEGETVCIGPRGTSMLPLIRQGMDAVELSPLPQKLKKYDLPLYCVGGKYILHRVVKVGKTYTCLGDNRLNLERGLTHNQMIAVVTAVYRGDQRIDVDSFGYQCYCRWRHWSRPLRWLWWKLRSLFGKA